MSELLFMAEAAALTLACGGGVRTGIFYVADVAIMVGTALLLLRRSG